MSNVMKKPFFGLTPAMTIGAVVAVFIGINVIMNVGLSGARFDLTSNNIYTLSDGTRNILNNLEEPIRIRFFYTDETATGIPFIQSYAERVKGLLKQYANISGGQVELEFINPEPFSKQEDQAVAFGIQAVPLSDLGSKLYFGLVANNSTDDLKTMSFIDPEREAFLEYDLTRMIYDLANPKKPVVGLLSWIDMDAPSYGLGGGGDDWIVMDQIKEQFEVRALEKDLTSIPEDVDTLMVIHPAEISEDTQYAIDQFVLKGGKALVFVDTHSELPGSQQKSSNLETLFKSWGVALEENQIVIDRANAMRMRAAGADSRLRMIDKPNWLALGKQYLNGDDIVTAELSQLRYISGGHLTATEQEGITFTPLLQTSEASMEVSSHQLFDTEGLIRGFLPSNQQFTLAGRIRGKAKTAFPNKTAENHIVESDEPINVIVVADTDMLRDQFWIQKQGFFGRTLVMQVADNGAFVANALENLSGSSDLIGLRSRSNVERPFTVVQELRRDAEARFLQEEKRLQLKLRETERKLSELQQGKQEGEGNVLLSTAQEQELDNFRQEMINTRQQLREVQHSLHQGIERLGGVFKFIHIGLIPVLIVILGLYVPRHLGIRRS